MKKIFSTSLFSVLAGMALGGILPAYAQTTPPPAPIQNAQGLLNILCTFAVYFFYTVTIITVIMVIWASFLYVTSNDDTEKITKARRTLTYAAVGVAVSLIAVGFPNVIGGLVGSTSTGSLAPHCSILGGAGS
jgi:FtsH-binding integral membrane protein